MKKVLVVSAVFVLCCLLFTGCGKTEATKAVQTMIGDIGSVNLDSEEQVNAVRAAYNALSDEEKAKVKNYDKLEKAENDLKDIKTFNADIAAVIEAAGTSFSNGDFKVSELIQKASDIENAYNGLSDEYKAQIKDFDKLTEAKQVLLGYVENAERAAAQYVKAFNELNKGKNYTVTQVYCIKQIRNEKDEYHFFALTYKNAKDNETTVYSVARIPTEVTALSVKAHPEYYFADKPVDEESDAKLSGNINISMENVNALLAQ